VVIPRNPGPEELNLFKKLRELSKTKV